MSVSAQQRRHKIRSVIRRCAASSAAAFLAVLLMTFYVFTCPAHAGDYDTKAWGDKFRYGAYSTLISSHILGTEFKGLIKMLNDPDADMEKIREGIGQFRNRYDNLTDEEIRGIIQFARKDGTASIYEEEHSVVSTIAQNKAFIHGMETHPELAPVDRLFQTGSDHFSSENFQFSAHRALYNDAYGIPQNSLAGIVNAYVAGIRNVEFDVLDTSDHVSVLIHDLVTNRLNAAYMDFPRYVEDRPYEKVISTEIGVLNPLVDMPTGEPTGLKMTTTEHVFKIVHALMPEMTLYVDARNDAPLSIIRLLHNHPEYRDNVVLKIYPFTLTGGLADVVEKYASRYFNKMQEPAIDEISTVNPHVLLAIGHAEMEANQNVEVSGIKGFSWRQFQAETKKLPFSSDSTLDYKTLSGERVFNPDELSEIEMRTFLLFKWTMGLTGVTNTVVFQMAALPSLVRIIEKGDVAEYKAMNAEPDKKYKISAAAQDNFVVLYKMVKAGDLKLMVLCQKDQDCPLGQKIQNSFFGLSDRFPDFAIATRTEKSDDIVNQDGMKNFNYNMLGAVYENKGYQPEKVRSTKAIKARVDELLDITGKKVVYATTDLPTDMRFTFMGLLGHAGLPEDIKHRANGIIKERLESSPSTFVAKVWTTRLNGKLHDNHPGFEGDYKILSDELKSITEKQQTIYSLRRTAYDDLPLTNTDAWKILGIKKVAMKDEIEKSKFKDATKILEAQILELNTLVQKGKIKFKKEYNVKFVGERGLTEY